MTDGQRTTMTRRYSYRYKAGYDASRLHLRRNRLTIYRAGVLTHVRHVH
jgi:hypothetical protein